MDIFNVLAVSARREILELLAAKGSLNASQISENFATSPPAISQHLKVLSQSNMINMKKIGKKRIYDLNPNWLLEFDIWARRLLELQAQKLDRLENLLNQSEK